MFDAFRYLPYGTKILHGIKFYGFTVGAMTVNFNSVKYYAPQVPPLRIVAAYVSCKQIAIISRPYQPYKPETSAILFIIIWRLF